ncbi:MAG TPA: putative Ig domain-containing protein, partial [Blastocatellia bacterium]|nr:putative Ig domain-containing protein [Blastocatellia bacterium]
MKLSTKFFHLLWKTPRGRCLGAILCILCVGYGWAGIRPHKPTANNKQTTVQGEAAIERLKLDGSYDSLAKAVKAARYQVVQQGDRFVAENPAQQFSASFTGKGVQIKPAQSSDETAQFGLRLQEYGYGENLIEVGKGETIASGDRIEIRQSAITEWYVNKPEGLEQGFTIAQRPTPSGSENERLQLKLGVIGDWQAEIGEQNQTVILKGRNDQPAFSYNQLAAWDADGKQLHATMNTNGQEITLEVDDREALYPLTIDPMIGLIQKLTASDGAAQDGLGASVSIKGNSVIAGAPGDNSAKGSAYVFASSGASWTQAKLQAPDGSTGDNFGWSVAIDGSTAVVGAPFDDSQRGSAYVFVYANGLWTYQAKLNAGDSSVGDGDRFGWSVSLSGNSVIVGSYQDDGNAGADQGAAYVFVRIGSTWTQQQKLVASDAAAGDLFGHKVAISGETAVVAADQDDIGGNTDQGSAYVFKRNGASWSQQKKLTGANSAAYDRFGSSVAISGTTILIGSASDDDNANNVQDCGTAYVFVFDGVDWAQQAKLAAADLAANDYFGFSVDISGDLAVIGAYGKNGFQGAAYVFARHAAIWTQQQKLAPGDGEAGDWFGGSVSVDGNTIISGAYVGGNINQGAAYVYQVYADIGQSQKIAGDGFAATGESFGGAIAISGDTAAISAWNWQNHTGIVRIYTRNANNSWTYSQSISASNGNPGDYFGSSLAIDGNILAVGVPYDHFLGSTYSGSVYVYTRVGATWGQEINFTASDTQVSDHFGASVAVSGNTLLVGASGDDLSGPNSNEGSAYVFIRNANGQWTQQGSKLTALGGNVDDAFGSSVALNGDTALIGSPSASLFGVTNRGLAYVFTRNNGTWNQWNVLYAADGAAHDGFGRAVAMDGNTAVISSQVVSQSGGSAYVFAFNGVNWVQQQKLKNGAAELNWFGSSLAIRGDWILIGAPDANQNGDYAVGAAYMYRRGPGGWSLLRTLVASDGAAYDKFGNGVAIHEDTALVGAPFDDLGADVDRGSAYVFSGVSCSAITITTGALPNGSVGNAYNLTLAASGGSGSYQFSLSGGNLPTGLTLAQNGHISGTATASGTYNFTVTATTPELCTGSKDFSITINGSCPSFTLNPATLPGGTVGVAYNQTVSPTGGTSPYLFNLSGTLPPGVQLNPNTGVLLGAPTTAGTFNFTITAIDVNFCQGSKAYSVTINQVGGISANDLQFYP